MSQQIQTQEQALNVLVQGVRVAQKRGAYDLAEASVISQAVGVFTPELPPAEATDAPEEATEETE